MNSDAPAAQCRALNVSDEKRCEQKATSVNGLFCAFHSRQCQGLYRGYKHRNARLDRLSANPPSYLRDSTVPLTTQTFEDVKTEAECRELYDYLFLKYQLLERVIRARKLHHARFFAMQMDYGHAKFLDSLQGQKPMISKALERLGRRIADVMYQSQEWFNWVRTCQDVEEEHREKEQKKVKMEAALFRRYWKATALRMRDKKLKEDEKKQDSFLEKIYMERMAEREANGELDDEDMEWDPIEDVLEDSRADYLDLIHHFLWIAMEDKAAEQSMPMGQSSSDIDMGDASVDNQNVEDVGKQNVPSAGSEKPSHSKNSKKNSKTIAASNRNSVKGSSSSTASSSQPAPDKDSIESRQEMHHRLKHGVESNTTQIRGSRLVGTLDNIVSDPKTKRFPDDEITKFLDEISEIKRLLFCRLVLGHAGLLPAALRADSIEAFLNDEQVTASALRDLCLKMEKPDLQMIRDACADLFRSNEEEEDVEMRAADVAEPTKKSEKPEDKWFGPKPKPTDLPQEWISQREKERRRLEKMGGSLPSLDDLFGGMDSNVIDFGEIKDEGKIQSRKVRVKVCGRSIWYYPSSKAMSRGGWLHFCIIAKDSNLFDAISLCRHWDEFFELNILACYGYFPGANWTEWVGDRFRSQLLQLGLIVYHDTIEQDAESLSRQYKTGGSRGSQPRKAHAIVEMRNVLCAHIKRDDQVSRRLIQYLSMQSHALLILVRDGETGKLIVKPPEAERWLVRTKVGLGRAAKNDWKVLRSIGPKFFEEMDKSRKWHFSFNEHYDVYIWDREPGEPFPVLGNGVQQMLFKALRCRTGRDLYNPALPILKTLCHDPVTQRVRDLRPTDEGIPSLADKLYSDVSQFAYGDAEGISAQMAMADREEQERASGLSSVLYNDADALEDEILFPEERKIDQLTLSEIGKPDPAKEMETLGFNMNRWVQGTYAVEDSDYDEPDWMDDDDKHDEDIDPDAVSATSADGSDWEDASDDDGQGKANTENLAEMIKLLAKMKLAKSGKELSRSGMDEEFQIFIDKERSKLFKSIWHKADLDPQAHEHYVEMKAMVRASRKLNQKKVSSTNNVLIMSLLKSMNVDHEDVRDVQKAVAKISPFFSSDFLNSGAGRKFEDSLLFNQEERSKMHLDRRTSTSSAFRPDSFYEELGEAIAKAQSADDLPFEWDLATRPILAHLYKAGVIRPGDDYFAGQAFAATESNRDAPDIYIDFRPAISGTTFPKTMELPTSIPPLKTLAASYASTHSPTARFALLRIWSAPHFYPLMLGFDNRDNTSFRDVIGRTFQWLFIPKDMPFSEYSIHSAAKLRMDPYRKGLLKKENVVVKCDRILVMAKNESELKKIVAATVLAVQGKPWRWEVDLWKSFVNVDGAFLENLRDDWVE